jgi:quinol monooxygenase YgiN
MFGTIARVQVLPGKDAELIELAAEWTRARGAATGQLVEYVFKLKDRPDVYAMVGIFADEQTYYANAADPKTDRWYQRMRALLVDDPQWHDGDVIQQVALTGI